MNPIIAIIGRPNVGKSTLFNNLIVNDNKSLISHYSGVTRDRNYGYCIFNNYKFTIIDTGGISYNKEKLEIFILNQTKIAIKEANIILFVVEGQNGLLKSDLEIADNLRNENKEIIVIINKIDKIININNILNEFYLLNIKNIIPVLSIKKYEIKKLIKKILLPLVIKIYKKKYDNYINKNKYLITEKKINITKKYLTPIKIAIVGKPNVGKSTFINYLFGSERVLVHKNPGTTHDSIYIPIFYDKKEYILIDTAGINKFNKTKNKIEKIYIKKTINIIKKTNLVLLFIDSTQGISNQDIILFNFIVKQGKSLIIVLNKSDKLLKKNKNEFLFSLNNNLKFINFVKIHFISALYGQGLNKLFLSINETYNNSLKKINSKKLTNILHTAINEHKLPIIKNFRRIKLKYAHIGGYNPLIIVIHGVQTKYLSNTYKRYLIKYFINSLNIVGTPIKLQFNENINPFTIKIKK